ncbi:hypothetical protein C8J56DRAFT_751445, partial [Mycena floridula]
LPTVKSNPLPGESKGSYILDVAKLSSRFGDDASMDFGQWSESSLNLVRFQAFRDKEGDSGPYASFWKLHRAFFDSQEDKIEMFPFWKEVQRGLQRQYISQPTKFDVQYYVTKYVLTQTKVFPNHSTTMTNMDFIAEYCSKEVAAGRVSGP